MSDKPQPFEWRGFLTLAQKLRACDGDAELRSAVSRAYYAVFHAALHLLHSEGIHLDRHDKHTALWCHFNPRDQRPGIPRERRKIGNDGARLRELRNQADYDGSPLNANDLRLAISRAEALLNALTELAHRRSPAAEPTSPR